MKYTTQTSDSHLLTVSDTSISRASEGEIPIFAYISGAFVVGMSIGYFSKKAMKLALFLFGMFIVSYLVLAYNNLLPTLNPSDLTAGANNVKNQVGDFGSYLFGWLDSVNASDVGGASLGAISGFFVGWKMG